MEAVASSIAHGVRKRGREPRSFQDTILTQPEHKRQRSSTNGAGTSGQALEGTGGSMRFGVKSRAGDMTLRLCKDGRLSGLSALQAAFPQQLQAACRSLTPQPVQLFARVEPGGQLRAFGVNVYPWKSSQGWYCSKLSRVAQLVRHLGLQIGGRVRLRPLPDGRVLAEAAEAAEPSAEPCRLHLTESCLRKYSQIRIPVKVARRLLGPAVAARVVQGAAGFPVVPVHVQPGEGLGASAGQAARGGRQQDGRAVAAAAVLRSFRRGRSCHIVWHINNLTPWLHAQDAAAGDLLLLEAQGAAEGGPGSSSPDGGRVPTISVRLQRAATEAAAAGPPPPGAEAAEAGLPVGAHAGTGQARVDAPCQQGCGRHGVRSDSASDSSDSSTSSSGTDSSDGSSTDRGSDKGSGYTSSCDTVSSGEGSEREPSSSTSGQGEAESDSGCSDAVGLPRTGTAAASPKTRAAAEPLHAQHRRPPPPPSREPAQAARRGVAGDHEPRAPGGRSPPAEPQPHPRAPAQGGWRPCAQGGREPGCRSGEVGAGARPALHRAAAAGGGGPCRREVVVISDTDTDTSSDGEDGSGGGAGAGGRAGGPQGRLREPAARSPCQPAPSRLPPPPAEQQPLPPQAASTPAPNAKRPRVKSAGTPTPAGRAPCTAQPQPAQRCQVLRQQQSGARQAGGGETPPPDVRVQQGSAAARTEAGGDAAAAHGSGTCAGVTLNTGVPSPAAAAGPPPPHPPAASPSARPSLASLDPRVADVCCMVGCMLQLMEQMRLGGGTARQTRRAIRRLKAADRDSSLRVVYLTLCAAVRAGDEEEVLEVFADMRAEAALGDWARGQAAAQGRGATGGGEAGACGGAGAGAEGGGGNGYLAGDGEQGGKGGGRGVNRQSSRL